MNSLEILEKKTVYIGPGASLTSGNYIPEDDAYDALDLGKREIAQSIIDKYHENPKITVSEILHYCYGIVDF